MKWPTMQQTVGMLKLRVHMDGLNVLGLQIGLPTTYVLTRYETYLLVFLWQPFKVTNVDWGYFVVWQEKSGVALVAEEKYAEPKEVEVSIYSSLNIFITVFITLLLICFSFRSETCD